MAKINKIYPLLQSNSFPFLEKTYDDINEYAILARLEKKVNEIIGFINTELNKELSDYINNMFNNIMLDTMYIEDTETLVLYLKKEE